MNTGRFLTGVLTAASMTALAPAQSLFLTDGRNPANPGENTIELEDVSLTYIPEPEAKEFRAHDIVTIIIDEVSSQESSQTLETEKESSTSANIQTVADLVSLLELRLQENGRIDDLDLIEFDAQREFEGEGEYEREDRFSARIAAEILEVKPNGTVVLEARKRIEKDDEIQTILIAGKVRTEDITLQNTVLSSQLADLTLSVQNEGEVRDAAKKGFLTKLFDTIFAF